MGIVSKFEQRIRRRSSKRALQLIAQLNRKKLLSTTNVNRNSQLSVPAEERVPTAGRGRTGGPAGRSRSAAGRRRLLHQVHVGEEPRRTLLLVLLLLLLLEGRRLRGEARGERGGQGGRRETSPGSSSARSGTPSSSSAYSGGRGGRGGEGRGLVGVLQFGGGGGRHSSPKVVQ